MTGFCTGPNHNWHWGIKYYCTSTRIIGVISGAAYGGVHNTGTVHGIFGFPRGTTIVEFLW